ncbi:hypothetical protein [Pseudooceanicola sp.]|uniref:hypothetical protein n=1 Tax=Pseudooceanicola sp. TaxID=1914328 RepID=UPI004059F594
MGRYRKKPVTIEAALFDGDLVGEPDGSGRVLRGTCPDWFPAVVREVSVPPGATDLRENEVIRHDGSLWIGTLEGAHRAMPGDMLIRGVQGELYPCKPENFAATYDGPVYP